MLKVVVMQQPSGFVDGVIVSWIISERATEIAQAVHLRDCYAAGFSESAMRASFLSHQLMSIIAGKLTAVLQVSDTDVAAPMKRGSDAEKRQILSERRDEALARNERPDLKWSCRDILRVVLAGHEAVEKLNHDNQYLLRAMRRNGFLRFKPDHEKGALVPLEQVMPELCEKMKEHSRTIPETWWNMRSPKFDRNGRPEPPEREGTLGRQKCEPDQLDEYPEQQPHEETKLHCCKGKGEKMRCFEKASVVLEGVALEAAEIEMSDVLEPLKRGDEERLEALLSKKETKVRTRKGSVMREKQQKMRRRLKRKAMRRLSRKANKAWCEEARAFALRYSRRQLLRALVPESQSQHKERKRKAERWANEDLYVQS